MMAVGVSLSLVGGSDTPAAPVAAPVPVADAPPATVFDEASSVEVARDAYTVTERDGNDLMRAKVSLQPSSVFREGQWVPISTALTSLDGGLIAAVDHPLEPVFAPLANADDLVHVQNDGYSLSLAVERADAVQGEQVPASAEVADGTAVRYEGALDGSDLLFEVGQQAIYQTVVLQSMPVSQPSYVWMLDAPGLLAKQQDSGDIQFLDPAGDVVFDIPGPVMWDSLGGDGGMADSASTPVKYTLADEGDGRWRLELKPDLAWLSDSARVYPVSIDPDVQLGIGASATYKEDNWWYNYASVPRIGNSKQTSTCCTWRTIFRFPLNGYVGERVIGGPSFIAQWTYGATATQAASLWWAYSFNFAGNGERFDEFTIGTWGGSSHPIIFDAIAYYLNTGDPNAYMMLVGEESDAVYSRKDLNLYLSFTYVDPAVVTGVADPTPVSLAAGPPKQVFVDDIVMQATGVNYTPGTSQLFRYNFTSSTGGVAWSSGWVAAGPYRVPDTALTAGKDYSYTIDTIDTGTDSPIKRMSQSTWMFHTRINPLKPTAVTVGGYPLVDGQVVTAGVARPDVTATVASPDGVPVWALFTVKQDGIVVMDSVPGAPADGNGVSRVTLPYALTAGGKYKIEVKAFDGHLASDVFSAPGQFAGSPGSVREIPATQDANTGAKP